MSRCVNLAKFPSSTMQLLGAEKASHDACASFVGSAQPKHKGKITRVLAATTALAVRVDALSKELHRKKL